MKIMELVDLVKAEKPELIGKMLDKRVVALLRAVFVQLGKHVDAQDSGVITVPGLGNFITRYPEADKKGPKAKRVIFHAASNLSSITPKQRQKPAA